MSRIVMFWQVPRLPIFAALMAAVVLLPVPVQAAPSSESLVADAGGVTVPDAWARASAGAATNGAVYVTLKGSAQPDQLVGASTPAAATAEVHETTNDNGVMKMRPVPGVPVPPDQLVTFAPGGTHIMLMGLRQPLTAGQSFPLTLTFAHAAPVTVDVRVRGIGGAMGNHGEMPLH